MKSRSGERSNNESYQVILLHAVSYNVQLLWFKLKRLSSIFLWYCLRNMTKCFLLKRHVITGHKTVRSEVR